MVDYADIERRIEEGRQLYKVMKSLKLRGKTLNYKIVARGDF